MTKTKLLGLALQHTGYWILGAILFIMISGEKLSAEYSANIIVLGSLVASGLIVGASFLIRVGYEILKDK